MCLGKVGLNNKFCVKECVEGRKHCGTGRHVAKYKVLEDAAYIRHTDNQVYASPSLDLKLLSDAQTAKLASMELSASDWEQLFADVRAGKFPSWLQQQEPEDDSMKDDELDQESFHLLSPVASKSKNGVFKIVPTFSFDSVNSETASQEDDQRPNLDKKLAKLEGKVVSLKNKVVPSVCGYRR